MNENLKKDAKVIAQLGGPTKVAQLLGYGMPFGVQRVSNWRVRGIPAKVKLSRPDLFLNIQQEAA